MFLETLVLEFLILFIAIALIYISSNYYNRIINPIVLFVVPLSLGCLFSFSSFDSNPSYSFGLIWIIIGILLFTSFFMLGQRLVFVSPSNNTNDYKRKYNLDALNLLVNICLCFLLVSFIYNFWSVMQVAGSFERIFTSSTSVRILYLQREKTVFGSLIGWFLTANCLVLSCLIPKAISSHCAGAKIKLVLAIFIRTGESLVTMSKQNIIIFLVLILASSANEFKSRKVERVFLKKYSKWLVLFIVLFLAIVAYQRNYLAERYDNYIDAILGTVLRYIGTPIYSFTALLAQPYHVFSNGAQCFRPFVTILSVFFGSGIGSSIQATIFGATANVYTIFGNMYNDFGKAGIVLLSIVFGLIFGCIYRKNTYERFSRISINSLISVVLFMSFYDFLLMQTVYLVTILYAVVLDRLLENNLYQKVKIGVN